MLLWFITNFNVDNLLNEYLPGIIVHCSECQYIGSARFFRGYISDRLLIRIYFPKNRFGIYPNTAIRRVYHINVNTYRFTRVEEISWGLQRAI